MCVPFVKWTKEQQVCFLWHLRELSDWLFWPALHWLAFDPIGERLHQQLKGWSVANGLLLIYCPIITGLSGRTGGNERGRNKRTEGFINKRREGGSKLFENWWETGAKIPPRPFLDVNFIRNGRCGGSTASLVHPYWLCGLFKDKAVMYLDWNDSKKSQTDRCFNFSSLSCSFVSQH